MRLYLVSCYRCAGLCHVSFDYIGMCWNERKSKYFSCKCELVCLVCINRVGYFRIYNRSKYHGYPECNYNL